MKILYLIWKKLEEILKNDFQSVLEISALNFLLYGINKYFLTKYFHHSIFIKITKFSLGFIEFIFIVLGIFLLLSFLPVKIKSFIIKIIKFLSYILFIIECMIFKTFNSIINTGFIQVTLETNPNESREFLRTYLNLKLISFTFIVSFLIFFICKYINKKINFNCIFKFKFFKIIFIIFLFIKLFDIPSTFYRYPLGRLIISTKNALNNIKEYKYIEKNLSNNIEIIFNNSNIKNIIFIIGESTTRNHMSLYGYPLDTNPLLKKLEDKGNLYKFTNTISPHAHTIPVIKKLLTFYNFESTKAWYEYNNIIDIFDKVNYNTYWFSNQESGGVYGNIAVAFSKKSKITLFNSYKDSTEDLTTAYDEQTINKSLTKINYNKKNFIIYHLMGTHTTYKNRYPKTFEKFKSDNNIIAEYNNAILYNDYVINKIIENFKDKESIIFYVSDHGEEVYDFRDFHGHAEDNGSRYMVEIPFLIYISDKFKEKYPEKVKAIESSLDNPYMTDDLIHTILDIVDIQTKEFDETRSIVNKSFNKDRKRIFSGHDYDTYWKNKN